MTKTEAGEWLVQARKVLAGHSDQPMSEAQALLGWVLGKTRSWVLAHPEADLSSQQQDRLRNALQRLAAGEPLPYLLGRWEFFGLELAVSPAVLIPRPETELLVEQALQWLQAHPGKRQAVDVGTGSGCIALALANHVPNLCLLATDRSMEALALAKKNIRAYGLEERVQFVLGDLLSALPGPFDLVCANLPYVPTQTLAGLAVNRHEPRLALDGGTAGLDLIERLLADLPAKLAPGGLALLEIEAGQGESAAELGRRYFPFGNVSVLLDLAGLPRLLSLQGARKK